jgi:hypothetical protein
VILAELFGIRVISNSAQKVRFYVALFKIRASATALYIFMSFRVNATGDCVYGRPVIALRSRRFIQLNQQKTGFWGVTPCSKVYNQQSFGGTSCLHLQDRREHVPQKL